MTKRRGTRRSHDRSAPAGVRSNKDAPDQAAPGGSQGGQRRPRVRWQHWRRSKYPVFRFVALLLVLLGTFQILVATDTAKDRVIPSYLRFFARLTGSVMRPFEREVRVHGATVSSPRFSVNIKRGCDAIQPTALFICGVLASPVLFWPKIPGLLGGLLFLGVMNLIRVVSLFYVGVYFSVKTFEIMHVDIWQTAFILLAILAWGLWAVWAARITASRSNAVS